MGRRGVNAILDVLAAQSLWLMDENGFEDQLWLLCGLHFRCVFCNALPKRSSTLPCRGRELILEVIMPFFQESRLRMSGKQGAGFDGIRSGNISAFSGGLACTVSVTDAFVSS